MEDNNTLQNGVIEQLKQMAESPEELQAALDALEEPKTPNLISDVARRTHQQVAELSESAAEENAVIEAAEQQVERFNNWWGRVTGQHHRAMEELDIVTASSSAKMDMIRDEIAGIQDGFDAVMRGALDHETAGQSEEFDALEAS